MSASTITRQATDTVPEATMTHQVNSLGLLSQVTDWNGSVTQFTYDATGRETQRIEDVNGEQRITNTTWSADFRLPTQIETSNLTIDFTYNDAGQVLQRSETDTSSRKGKTRVWDFTYDTDGSLLTVTGPRTDLVQTTTYTYQNYPGYLQTVTNALGQTTTINTVNVIGLPTKITDPNGVVTNMTYDPVGRVSTVSVQGPVVATTSFSYDVNGLLTSVTSPEGIVLSYDYDDAHRMVGMSDSVGNSMEFTLDGLGNRTQSRILNGTAQILMTATSTFDSLGRLLESLGASSQVTSYQYDNNGNTVLVSDPRMAVTQNAFDGLNRLVQTTDALTGVTDLAYDGESNLAAVTDARSNTTSYEVNGFGFVTKTISPDSGTTIYTHDLAGNILTSKDDRRVTATYTYDALDRPLTRSYGSGATENITFIYDQASGGNYGIGKLTFVADQAGSSSFIYDAYGNKISETRVINGTSYTTDYGYDLDGQVAQIVYPSGLSVTYQRDTLGQIVGATMQADGASPIQTLASNGAYLPFGPMASITLGNGVQLTRTFDLDYRPTAIQASGPNIIQSLILAYDDAGNITSIEDALSPTLTQAFQYDLLGRVTQGTGLYGEDNYTYDALGNRLTRTLVNGGTIATTYTYDASSNQLLSMQTGSAVTNFSHDELGSRIQAKFGSGKNAPSTNYTYNSAGRLASVGSVTYQYNAFGERAVKTEPSGGTHYLFREDGLLLAEYTAQGSLIRNYVYLDGQPLAIVDAAGGLSYVLNDHIGQPQKVLDTAGNIIWHRASGIYGDTVTQLVGSTADNPLRFPGQQFDPASAFHYNYYRDYDPASGRYLETDPIGINGGINLYLYAHGNPVNLIDPSGEFVPLAILGGMLVGAGSDLAVQAGLNWLNGNDVFDLDCYNWSEAGLAGALGAFTGGAGGAGLKTAAGLSAKFSNVSKRIRRGEGLVGSGKDLHHWAIPRKYETAFGGRAAQYVNGRWNLNPVDAGVHTELHKMGKIPRTIAGAPDWAKMAAGASGISIGTGMLGDIFDGECACAN